MVQRPCGRRAPVTRLTYPTELGDAAAWEFAASPGSKEDPGHWALHIHGRGALPEETLRGVIPAARSGLRSLVIQYRNDPEAPRGLRGRYGLGLAEQLDVDAAISSLRARGATRISLIAYSMGATAAILSATRGPHRDVIRVLILDSPALDWPGILGHQARLARVPSWVAWIARALMSAGLVRGALSEGRGMKVSSLTPEAFAAALDIPTLILAGPEDTYVPWQGSVRLAELSPRFVTLHELKGEHVKHWNRDPRDWESSIEAALRTPDTGERAGEGEDWHTR